MLLNEKPPSKSFRENIVEMVALQKLQNSLQTPVILWPVYSISTNSLSWGDIWIAIILTFLL